MRKISKNARATIILVHGGFEHCSRYRWLMSKLVEEGFNVVTGDLPGHGLQPTNRGDIDEFSTYVKHVHEWVEEARELKVPLILLGHSMGGLICIRYIQEYGPVVSKVVLSSPCLGLAEPPDKTTRVLVNALMPFLPTFKVPVPFEGDKITRNRDVQIDLKNDPLYLRKVTIRWVAQLEKAIQQAFNDIEKTPHIPLVIMQAGDDKIVDKHEVKKWYETLASEHAVYKEWESLYHEIFHEREREEVLEYTLKVLKNEVLI